jgi:hypothetical protein
MITNNPHAAEILRLPAGNHPKLRGLVISLANDPTMTTKRAQHWLMKAAANAGITGLDFEMIEPGNATPQVAFVPTRATSAEAEFQTGVNAHLRQILKLK